MAYHAAATTLALLHLAYIVFVVLGGLLVLRWRWVMYVHVPAVLWAAFIEIAQWNCPLTTWENLALHRAGQSGYEKFIAHHLFAIIYPRGLTRGMEIALAVFVTVVNTAVYHHIRVSGRNARRRAAIEADRA